MNFKIVPSLHINCSIKKQKKVYILIVSKVVRVHKSQHIINTQNYSCTNIILRTNLFT